jgi:phosphotransferase system enzyme I (PtsP)
VADRFDPISVPILRALRQVIEKGRAYGKPVTLCGELASKPIGALALVALGYRSLSLSPSAIGPIKSMLLDVDTRRVGELVCEMLDAPATKGSVRDKLADFAALEGLQF